MYQNGKGISSKSSSEIVSRNEVVEIITKGCDLINTYYVFPEIANEICKLLKDKLDSEEYFSIYKPDELAEQLLKDIQSFNGDKHLRVLYDAEQVQMLRRCSRYP